MLLAYKVIIQDYKKVLNKMTSDGKSLRKTIILGEDIDNENKNVIHFASENCESYETFSIIFEHFISESNFMNELDIYCNSPLDILIERKKEKKKEHYFFTLSFVENIIEKNLKVYDELQIKFETFKTLCERKGDSTVNKIKIIEYLIGKIRYSKNEENLAVHYLITNKRTYDLYSDFLLKRLIENQKKEFVFKLKNDSFRLLLERKDLDLIKLFIERATLDDNQMDNSLFDIFLQLKANNELVFSNIFIKKINENSNLFKCNLNYDSFLNFCERNEPKLMVKFKDNFDFEEKDFKRCIEIFIEHQNLDTAKCVLEHVKRKNFSSLADFIKSSIDHSLKCKDFKIAEYFTKIALNENVFENASFQEYALNKKFINYLLEQKSIDKDFILQTKRFLEDDQNLLHFAAEKYSSEVFLGLMMITINIDDDSINSYLNQSNSKDNLTPFDYAIEYYVQQKFEKSFLERFIYKLTRTFKLQMSRKTFINVLEKKDEINLESVKLLIEKSSFYLFKDNSNQSPIDLLIENGFSSFFIKQINLKSDIFTENVLILSDSSFEKICENYDIDLFEFLVDISKKHQRNTFMEKLYEKKEKLIDFLRIKQNSKIHLILKYFFDYKHPSRFDYIKQALRTAIDNCIDDDYQLTKFILQYLKNNKNDLINQNTQDYHIFEHKYIEKICDSKQWQLIELILDCSYFSESNKSKFFLSHFDYEYSTSTNNQQNSDRNCLPCCCINMDYVSINKPIKKEKHILYRIVESGQKQLINHPTIVTHLKYKWERIPRYAYYIFTFLKLFYLILFSLIVFTNLNDNKLRYSETHQAIKWILIILCAFFFFYEILQIGYEKISYFWYEFKFNNNQKKLNLKNFSELVSSILSLIVLTIIFFHQEIKRYISIETSFQVISYITPLCIILRYIEFILSLEKFNKIGIYIVAFRQSFENSLLLFPLIVTLLCGFIVAFKIGTNSPNETFFNSTLLESVAEIEKMLIANIADIDKLGMKSDGVITNYILYSLFILLVPIILINLLIGVSTGQLNEVLQSSEIIQFELQVTYSLRIQELLYCNKLLFDHFHSKFLVPINGPVENKAFNFRKEISRNEFEEIKIQLESKINILKINIKQNREDVLVNLYELNDKLQNLQENILEKYKENDKRIKTQLEDLDTKFFRQLDLLAIELN